MPGAVEIQAFRRNLLPNGHSATKEDREKLLKPYLPEPNNDSRQVPSKAYAISRRPHLRSFLTKSFHWLIFYIIQLCFSVYITLRQTYHALLYRFYSILYYHHRTPELIQRDIQALSRLPKHLSIIVDLETADINEQGKAGDSEAIMKLIGDVAELSCWCACAGIPMVSIYERTGVLKQRVPTLHRAVTRVMQTYFPPSSSQRPSLHVRAPHQPTYSPPTSPSPSDDVELNGTSNGNTTKVKGRPDLNILLLSASDGRETMVDLTKTLAEMAQRGRIRPADVTTELIDAELSASSCGEPDLLVMMTRSSRLGAAFKSARGKSRGARAIPDGLPAQQDTAALPATGGDIYLRGYPPWQVRLAEIFNVQDNVGVDYQVFLRALHRYAKAELRFGR